MWADLTCAVDEDRAQFKIISECIGELAMDQAGEVQAAPPFPGLPALCSTDH